MLELVSQERRDALDFRTAEIVAYVTERLSAELPDVDIAVIMKSVYHSKRYMQLIDYDTYIYTFTFDELYQMFLEELVL